MNKTYIIAECACAHVGNIEYAKRMIDIAINCGCDAVKFQAFNPDKIPNITQQEYEFLVKAAFNKQHFQELIKYNDNRAEFLLTPFDMDSIDLCRELAMPMVKVPSGRVTDKKHLSYIRKHWEPSNIIVSAGMLHKVEVSKIKSGNPGMKWLHCVSAYPAPIEQLNLNVLKGSTFDGFSDHTLSTWVPALAVACGAKIIEKHITLSRGLSGPDQRCSIEPEELFSMVQNIRDVEKMMGSGAKSISDCERKMMYRKVNK